jgi:hypothetical protein
MPTYADTLLGWRRERNGGDIREIRTRWYKVVRWEQVAGHC